MKKSRNLYNILIIISLLSLISLSQTTAQTSKQATPLLGWNSYDCYGTHINAELTWKNLKAFIKKLKPYGYNYFVLDAGWYRYYDLKPGEIWPTDGDKEHLTLDKYRRYVPAKFYFPEGFDKIIEYAHKHGVKFGLHLM